MSRRKGGAARSGDLRSRFPTGPVAVPPVEMEALRRRAYGQGLIVIDTRSQAFKAQGFAMPLLDWYSREMGG